MAASKVAGVVTCVVTGIITGKLRAWLRALCELRGETSELSLSVPISYLPKYDIETLKDNSPSK